jgi:hypothetical protein
MTNPAFYDYVHSYNGDCASRANWDRSFADVTISTTTGAGPAIDVTTSTALGGAIASLKVNRREYIASGGHGGALQWAFHAWRAGTSATECYNPTQAGSRLDDAGGPPWHGPSTSALYVHQQVGASSVRTESRPAMYIERADPNPGFGGCRAGDYQPDRVPYSFGLSPYWLRTSVGLGPENGVGGLDNVIRMSAALTSEDDVYPNFDGLLVAYLQRRFTDTFTLDPGSGRLSVRQPNDPGVPRPIVRCTAGRDECLGMYFRPAAMPSAYYYALTNGPTPYNGNSGEYTVQVTVPATGVGAAAARELTFEVFIAVGNLGQTVGAIRKLASPGEPVLSPLDDVAPRVAGLRVRPARFRAARAAKPRVSGGARAKTGARLRFGLSERATVRIGVERRRPRAGWVRLRHGPAPRMRAAGRVRIPFSGRIGRRALRPGRYRVAVRAIDVSGNRSRVARARFRIVK